MLTASKQEVSKLRVAMVDDDPGNKPPPPPSGLPELMGDSYLGLANSASPRLHAVAPSGQKREGKDCKDMKDACDALVFGDLDALWPAIFLCEKKLRPAQFAGAFPRRPASPWRSL